MATLIAVYNSEGCVGRCDAKCYDAQSAECDCICGGANHGTGLDKAVENTRDRVEDWLQEYAKEKGLENYRTVLNSNLVDQLNLFDLFDTANLARAIAHKKSTC